MRAGISRGHALDPGWRARLDVRCHYMPPVAINTDLARSYGGNPLACAVACTALDVLVDEDLCNRALELGKTFRAGLETLKQANGGGWVTEIRGVGLFTAIVIDEHRSKRGRGAWELCCLMASKGALAKPTHVNMCVLSALSVNSS